MKSHLSENNSDIVLLSDCCILLTAISICGIALGLLVDTPRPISVRSRLGQAASY